MPDIYNVFAFACLCVRILKTDAYEKDDGSGCVPGDVPCGVQQ